MWRLSDPLRGWWPSVAGAAFAGGRGAPRALTAVAAVCLGGGALPARRAARDSRAVRPTGLSRIGDSPRLDCEPCGSQVEGRRHGRAHPHSLRATQGEGTFECHAGADLLPHSQGREALRDQAAPEGADLHHAARWCAIDPRACPGDLAAGGQPVGPGVTADGRSLPCPASPAAPADVHPRNPAVTSSAVVAFNLVSNAHAIAHPCPGRDHPKWEHSQHRRLLVCHLGGEHPTRR